MSRGIGQCCRVAGQDNCIDDTINLIYYSRDVLNICYLFNTESVA